MTRPSSATGREGRGQRGNSVAWEDGAEERAALELVVRANRGSDVTPGSTLAKCTQARDTTSQGGKNSQELFPRKTIAFPFTPPKSVKKKGGQKSSMKSDNVVF